MKFKAIVAVAFVLVLLVTLATPSTANTSPVAEDDYYSMAPDTTLNVGVPGVLGNDYDSDGAPIVVRMYNPPSSGTMLLWADGHFTYTPNAGFTGVDSFHYYISNSSIGDVMDDAYAYITVSAVVDVDIDIRPGSDTNPINAMSKGVIPVAILGAEDFDVMTVDPASLRLSNPVYGLTPPSASPLRWSWDDVNRDGFLDLVSHFDTQEVAGVVTVTNSPDRFRMELRMTGNLMEEYGGLSIIGYDTITVINRWYDGS